MGIDVYLYEQEGEEWVANSEPERLANTDLFLVMAYMFGMVLDPIRHAAETCTDPDLREQFTEGVEEFDRYLAEHREEGLARFEGYYEFLKKTLDQVRAQGMEEILGGNVVEQLALEDIHEDSRAFFGWFMLSSRELEPEELIRPAPIIGMALGMMNQTAQQYRDEDENLARMMADAYSCLEVAARFSDQAMTESKRLFFSC